MADESKNRIASLRDDLTRQQREMRQEQEHAIDAQRRQREEMTRSRLERALSDMKDSRRAATVAALGGAYAGIRGMGQYFSQRAQQSGAVAPLFADGLADYREPVYQATLGKWLNRGSGGFVNQNREYSVAYAGRMNALYAARARDIQAPVNRFAMGLTQAALLGLPGTERLGSLFSEKLGLGGVGGLGRPELNQELIKQLEFMSPKQLESAGIPAIGGKIDPDALKLRQITSALSEGAYTEVTQGLKDRGILDTGADKDVEAESRRFRKLFAVGIAQDREKLVGFLGKSPDEQARQASEFELRMRDFAKELRMSTDSVMDFATKMQSAGFSVEATEKLLEQVSKRIAGDDRINLPAPFLNRAAELGAQAVQQGLSPATSGAMSSFLENSMQFDPLQLASDRRGAYGATTSEQTVELSRRASVLGQSQLAKVLTYGGGGTAAEAIGGFQERLSKDGGLGYLEAQYDPKFLQEVSGKGAANVIEMFRGLEVPEAIKVTALAGMTGGSAMDAKNLLDSQVVGADLSKRVATLAEETKRNTPDNQARDENTTAIKELTTAVTRMSGQDVNTLASPANYSSIVSD